MRRRTVRFAGSVARLQLAVAIASLGAIAACGPEGPGARSPASPLVAKNVVTLEGTPVSTACTPTGPELCFNAQDDNCNGVIDEGCGSGTGVLQFMVAWGDSPADIDLVAIDPRGAKVHKGNRSNGTGLQYERDCPGEGCHGQNIENIFFEGPDPAPGKYLVEVKLDDPRGADLPVKVHLSARVGARTFAADFALEPFAPKDKQGFTFEL